MSQPRTSTMTPSTVVPVIAGRARRLPRRDADRRHPRKHHISPASVGNIVLKAGLTRGRRYTGDELVEMIVAWFVGDDVGESERDAITKIGVHLAQPGLRSLVDVDPAIAERVRHRLADVLNERSASRSGICVCGCYACS